MADAYKVGLIQMAMSADPERSLARAIDFIGRQAKAEKRFFAYVPITQLHYPTLPHREFEGRTGAGDFADSGPAAPATGPDAAQQQ